MGFVKTVTTAVVLIAISLGLGFGIAEFANEVDESHRPPGYSEVQR